MDIESSLRRSRKMYRAESGDTGQKDSRTGNIPKGFTMKLLLVSNDSHSSSERTIHQNDSHRQTENEYSALRWDSYVK
jgi:hypothetical protein